MAVRSNRPWRDRLRLTGYSAIDFAAKHDLRLSKHPSRLGAAGGLTVAEATALAEEDETLIYLDLPHEEPPRAALPCPHPER